MTRRAPRRSTAYPRFGQIDGSHPFRQAAPAACVEYEAQRRRDAEVAWFNFDLAKDMGLVPRDHPRRLNPALRRAILDAFAIVIINEYDLLKRTKVSPRDRLDRRYMATRYLQLQHPGRQGRTSGDGRSVWNGTLTHRGTTWDVSSCGTGVTCLCPATAENKQFYRTGSAHASYGCGTAGLDEGISAALMSETFHRNGIATERVLAVIALPKGRAINVRAGPNLLRPSHFFVHLKQNDAESLRATVDLFIDRQIANGDWPRLRGRRRRYDFFARELARTFARITAAFESEYIFCWLDWDGDNILADGGIIDYGSVRQFGLYHREYRFDDGPRWSTTLPEQRQKARALVQAIAQIRDFLIRGHKRPLAAYANDRATALFDAEFERERRRRLLYRMGLPEETHAGLVQRPSRALARFQRAHAYFERARAARGPQRVPDGLSWNAIYSTRDLLRELPQRLLADAAPISARELLDIVASSYASRRDRALTPHRSRMAREFQRAYLDLVRSAARKLDLPFERVLATTARRAALINRRDRTTGNGIDYATARILRSRRKLSSVQLHEAIDAFVAHQDLTPRRGSPSPPRARAVQRLLANLLSDVDSFRHGL